MSTSPDPQAPHSGASAHFIRPQMLWAQALGDALGAATEFMDADEAQQVYGPWSGTLPAFQGGGPFGFAPGEITDDTQMALMVSWCVCAPGWDALSLEQQAAALGQAFAGWLDSSPPDVGMTTARALRSGPVGAWQGGGGAGNGGLMRLGGWLAGPQAGRASQPGASTEAVHQALAQAVLQGAVTHLDARSALSCAAAANLCLELSRQHHARAPMHHWDSAGAAVEALWGGSAWALDHAEEVLRSSGLLPQRQAADWRRQLSRELDAYEQATEDGLRGVDRKPGGFVLDTWRCALAHLMRSSSVPVTDQAPSAAAQARLGWTALQAARGGDDSDSVGAVACALVGAAGGEVATEAAQELRCGHTWRSEPTPALRAAGAEPFFARRTEALQGVIARATHQG